MGSAHDVRKMTAADVRPVSEALARAFEDDPVMTWMFPKDATRRASLRRFFVLSMKTHYVRRDQSYTTGAMTGAALWAPPRQWKVGTWEIVRSTPTMLRLLGRQMPVALSGLSTIETVHPSEDHYYLGLLGTDPSHQGKGVGGALMAPVLARCDREGIGAYLESSKERNVPYYERFGFRVTQELTLPKGPPVWPMWRDPQG